MGERNIAFSGEAGDGYLYSTDILDLSSYMPHHTTTDTEDTTVYVLEDMTWEMVLLQVDGAFLKTYDAAYDAHYIGTRKPSSVNMKADAGAPGTGRMAYRFGGLGFGYRAIRLYDCVLTEEQMQHNHTVDLLARHRVDVALYTALSAEEQKAFDEKFASIMMDDTSNAALTSELVSTTMMPLASSVLSFDGISVRTNTFPGLRAAFTYDLGVALPEGITVVEIGALTAPAQDSIAMQDLILTKENESYVTADHIKKTVAYSVDKTETESNLQFIIRADFPKEYTSDDCRTQHLFRGYVIFSANGAESICYINGVSETYYPHGRISMEDASRIPALKELPTSMEVVQTVRDSSLKILMIGNSFSADASTYLYKIATAMGYEDIVIGNLNIGGCSLATHAAHTTDGEAAYSYAKWPSDGSGSQKLTLEQGLTDEEWTCITLQQVSHESGRPQTFTPHLQTLIDFIASVKTNPKVRIGWHMTWAYQQGSNHYTWTINPSAYYNADQTTMYNAICDAVQNHILANPAISFLVPSGTAIQNTRTGSIGDNLTKDTYHLNDTGRLIAGYTFFATLTGTTLTELPYVPSNISLSDAQRTEIVQAINHAVEKPFEVTPVTHE